MFFKPFENQNKDPLKRTPLPPRASRQREVDEGLTELKIFDIFLLSLEYELKIPDSLKEFIDNKEYADMILQSVLLDPKNSDEYSSCIYEEIKNDKKMPVSVSSCHPTATGLRDLLKNKEDDPKVLMLVSKNEANLKDLGNLFNTYLQNDSIPCILQIKCTGGDDGHSFTLIKSKENQIGVYEAWGNEKSNCSLRELRKCRLNNDPNQCGEYETINTSFMALRNLMHANPEKRLDGFMTLSDAYTTLSEIETGGIRNIEVTCVPIGNWIEKLNDIKEKCFERHKQFIALDIARKHHHY